MRYEGFVSCGRARGVVPISTGGRRAYTPTPYRARDDRVTARAGGASSSESEAFIAASNDDYGGASSSSSSDVRKKIA